MKTKIIDVEIPPDANMIFASLPNTMITGLRDDGLHFYDWPEDEKSVIRLVCAFDTRMEDVEAFIASATIHSS